MKLRGVFHEAWFNTALGPARALTLWLIWTALAAFAVGVDLANIASLERGAQQFQDSGASTMVLSLGDGISPQRCDALDAAPAVTGSGALKKSKELYLSVLPSSSVPHFEATPGLADVLGVQAQGAGVWISQEFADTLSVEVGDEVWFTSGLSRVAAIFDYPADGRTPGMGYAVVTPSSSLTSADACWMKAWPIRDEATTLMRAVALPDFAAAKGSAEFGQLNATLGPAYDAAQSFEQRETKWAALVAAVLSFVITFVVARTRKLEFASARHIGVKRSDQMAIAAAEVLVPAALSLITVLCAVVIAAHTWTDDVLAWLLAGAVTPIAIVASATIAHISAVALIRERDILMYFKER